MANQISYNLSCIQPSLIESGWPKSDDGKVYLSNVPDNQKEYCPSTQCTVVRHPDGYVLIVDDKIKDKIPLEDSADKKIQALARKYILMECGQNKKSISFEMRNEFSYDITKFAVERAKSEKGALYDKRSQEWTDISLARIQLDRRIKKYEQTFEVPYFDSSPEKGKSHLAWTAYFTKNHREIINKTAKEVLAMSPVIASAAIMLAGAWIITRIVFYTCEMGAVVGAFVFKSLAKKIG
jgi:hypothetical protein